MKPKLQYATFERRARAGIALGTIFPVDIKPGDRVITVSRVSSHDGSAQNRRENLENQKIKLRQIVEDAGGIVVDEFAEEWSGRGPSWLDKLGRLARKARKLGVRKLVAACTDRWIRNELFRSDKKSRCHLRAQEHDLLDLDMELGNYRLPPGHPERLIPMTYLHPDAPPSDCRSLSIQWGQEVKDNAGGRPIKNRKKRKAKGLTRLQELHLQGRTGREIAKKIAGEFHVSLVTAYAWIKEAKLLSLPHAPTPAKAGSIQ